MTRYFIEIKILLHIASVSYKLQI